MIVGIVTLFAVLFLGGNTDFFFVDKLEKGVKEYVEDKYIRKEILDELAHVKNQVKAFNKNQKSQLDKLKEINLNYSSSISEFDSLYDVLKKEREVLQDSMIDIRLRVVSKITDDEWNKIISLSKESVEKNMKKLLNKKSKDNFSKLEQSILENVNKENHSKAKQSFDQLKTTFLKLEEEVIKINTIQNEKLVNKYLIKQEMIKEATELSKLRSKAYKTLQEFHFEMITLCEENEYKKIMIQLNKLLGE